MFKIRISELLNKQIQQRNLHPSGHKPEFVYICLLPLIMVGFDVYSVICYKTKCNI